MKKNFFTQNNWIIFFLSLIILSALVWGSLEEARAEKSVEGGITKKQINNYLKVFSMEDEKNALARMVEPTRVVAPTRVVSEDKNFEKIFFSELGKGVFLGGAPWNKDNDCMRLNDAEFIDYEYFVDVEILESVGSLEKGTDEVKIKLTRNNGVVYSELIAKANFTFKDSYPDPYGWHLGSLTVLDVVETKPIVSAKMVENAVKERFIEGKVILPEKKGDFLMTPDNNGIDRDDFKVKSVEFIEYVTHSGLKCKMIIDIPEGVDLPTDEYNFEIGLNVNEDIIVAGINPIFN